MKKKTIIVIAILAVILVGGGAIFAVTTLPGMMSTRSFEAVVQEDATVQNGVTSITVNKTTEVYGSPLCTLYISGDTELIDSTGNAITATDFQPGDRIKVSLQDSSVEGNPMYYPTVFKIEMIE